MFTLQQIEGVIWAEHKADAKVLVWKLGAFSQEEKEEARNPGFSQHSVTS